MLTDASALPVSVPGCRARTAVESRAVIRFFIQFLVLQAVLFGAELTPWAQEYFVVPWTNTLAAMSARLVTFFDANVIATGKDEVAYDLAEKVTADLEKAGLDILYDDRTKVSPGVKFGDAEILGVPTIVIVGRGAADGIVELWDRRSGDRREVPVADVAAELVPRA